MKQSIEEKAVAIGARMVENGAEISRVEDTVFRILKASGTENIQVFCISSVIIVGTENGVTAKRIRKNDLNLWEIDRLNAVSRAICSGEALTEKENSYSTAVKLISTLFATGSFCIYFGGNLYDAVIAGIIGIVISFKKSFINGIFAKTLADSVIAGMLSFLPSLWTKVTHPDKIMIGTIMLLIPGLTVSNAIRDMMRSDVLSGIIEITEAVFTAIAISLGFAVAVVIFQ